MKVYFNGFWNGFIEKTDGINVEFFIKLLTDVYSEEIIVSDNLDDSEILVESVFIKNEYINYKKWKTSFLFTGESYYANCTLEYLSSYTCILGYNDTMFNFVEFPLYIPYFKLNPTMTFEPVKNIKNNNVSVVISNENSLERIIFLERLEKRMNVLYGGGYKNNIGGRLEGHFASDSLHNFYKNSKFVITMENTKKEHYITEKLINGFRAGIIPVYWGSPHISEHFNTKRFLILEDDTETSINEVIDRMVNMSDEEYFQIVNQPIFNNGINIDIIYNKAINNIKKLVIK